ncbi:MAG TPA: CoA transferase [Dehalococcoidia bacterium]|nr:CoA transferase [Dehalococcoidia bacterium]
MVTPDSTVVPGALNGIRILDFTHVLAGPFATRILGDLGADVVKVNPASRAETNNGPTSPYYIMWNRNKRALALEMSTDRGKAICRRLAESADVVIDNFSVGVLDRWSIGYDEVSKANPGVVYVQMSGMGEGGPWSNFVTYAPTIHALSGLTAATGVPGREDIGIGFSYNDHQSGLHGAVAILAALESRRESGRGQRVDLSQFEVGATFAGPSLLDLFVNGRAAQPTGNRLPYDDAAPHNTYPCQPLGEGVENERWVAIACMDDDQWLALRRVMGNPPWAADERYHSAIGRTANLEVLDDHIADWTGGMAAEQVMALCQANGIPAGVVQNGEDLAEHDPQLKRSGFLYEIADGEVPEVGATYADRLPLHFQRTPADTYHRVRMVGEDNHAVLSDWLEVPASEIKQAEQDGTLT